MSTAQSPRARSDLRDGRDEANRRRSRYELLVKIASGGMATVYVGRLRGPAGFSRLVAVKRAHAYLIDKPDFRRMLIAEARLASRLHHPNAIAIDDIEELEGELRLVMDYVEGASLAELVQAASDAGRRLPPAVAVRIALDACAGLQAAHELVDDAGRPLKLVHRDVTPHNVLVGRDGTARLADFGIAKCAWSSMSTGIGSVKGKLGYMAPEYVQGGEPDARSDVFGVGVVLWEALVGHKLFRGINELETMRAVVEHPVPLPSAEMRELGDALDDVVMAAVAKSPAERFQSVRALATALEAAARKVDLVGRHEDVAEQVEALVGARLAERRERVRATLAQADGAASGEATQSHRRPNVAQASAAIARTVDDVPPTEDDERELDGDPAGSGALLGGAARDTVDEPSLPTGAVRETFDPAVDTAPSVRAQHRPLLPIGVAAVALIAGGVAALALARGTTTAAPAGADSALSSAAAPPAASASSPPADQPAPATARSAGDVVTPAASARPAPAMPTHAAPRVGSSTSPAPRMREPSGDATAAPIQLPANPYGAHP